MGYRVNPAETSVSWWKMCCGSRLIVVIFTDASQLEGVEDAVKNALPMDCIDVRPVESIAIMAQVDGVCSALLRIAWVIASWSGNLRLRAANLLSVQW